MWILRYRYLDADRRVYDRSRPLQPQALGKVPRYDVSAAYIRYLQSTHVSVDMSNEILETWTQYFVGRHLSSYLEEKGPRHDLSHFHLLCRVMALSRRFIGFEQTQTPIRHIPSQYRVTSSSYKSPHGFNHRRSICRVIPTLI
jgi:hypothetical protein